MSKSFILATAAVAIASCLFASNAKAGHTTGIYANATSSCQSSLPVYDANVRKSPLAVSNVGDKNVFVTCSFESILFPRDISPNPIFEVEMYVTNHSGADVDLTCTLVDGYEFDAAYYPRTLTLRANAQYSMVFSGNLSPDGAFSGPVSVNCLLPAGVSLNDHYVYVTTPDAPSAAR